MSHRVEFVIRHPAEGGGWYYDRHHVPSPEGDSRLPMDVPPVVGDRVHLSKFGLVEIYAREWSPSSWGSTNWSILEQRQTVPMWVTLFCDPCDGLYVDQVTRPEDLD